ncbi:MAG: porin family protein [Rhizobiales bacterium]|nr:porin family protein [Hyphomicrobiales bacterium]
MGSFRQRLVAACAILAASFQACAADTPGPIDFPQMRPSVVDWHGPYGGVLLAVKSFQAQIAGLGGTPDNIDGSGRLAGIVAGYNLSHNNMVYGLEGDVGYGQIRALSGQGKLEADIMGTLRARLGYDFEGSLLFATAGATFAGVNKTSRLMVKGDTSTHIGWIVGGGLEHAFARSLTGRIEYLYGRNLQDKNTGIRDIHMIRAGVVYHLPD